MFAYCGNNPVSRIDMSGTGWQVVIIGFIAGMAIGSGTAWLGATVTGQDFTWLDAGISALAGGVSTFGAPGLWVGGFINGGYSAYSAYENGANPIGIVGTGVSSFCFSMLSFGDLAKAGNELADIVLCGFVDTVFGIGFGSSDAAVFQMIVQNNQKTTSCSKNMSAIDVAMKEIQNSCTRIYNGQVITVGTNNCSYPGWYSNDPNRVYCYVQF